MGIKHRNKIILGIGLGMFVAVIVAGYLPKAHSFSGFKGKTLWDWLSLAGVPLSLAGLGFWLQIQQQKQNDLQKERELRQTKELAAVEREQTEKLAAIEQDIAEQNRQEEALQNYYDKVSALLVDKNLLAIAAKGDTATPEEKELLDVSVDVIRARTLTTLRRLDSTRKTSLIRFLLEAEVITRLKVSLEEAELSHANLYGAKLFGVNLTAANLSCADLVNADVHSALLRDACMEGAELASADLKRADLTNTDLRRSQLFEADLTGAKLINADLTKADLTDALLRGTFLINTILSHAEGLTKEQLEGENPPYLCDTKLPEGIDIDPNRDCLKLSSTNEIESSHAAQETNPYLTDTPPTTGRP